MAPTPSSCIVINLLGFIVDKASFVVLLQLFVEVDDGNEGDGLGAKDGGDEEDEDEEHDVK